MMSDSTTTAELKKLLPWMIGIGLLATVGSYFFYTNVVNRALDNLAVLVPMFSYLLLALGIFSTLMIIHKLVERYGFMRRMRSGWLSLTYLLVTSLTVFGISQLGMADVLAAADFGSDTMAVLLAAFVAHVTLVFLYRGQPTWRALDTDEKPVKQKQHERVRSITHELIILSMATLCVTMALAPAAMVWVSLALIPAVIGALSWQEYGFRHQALKVHHGGDTVKLAEEVAILRRVTGIKAGVGIVALLICTGVVLFPEALAYVMAIAMTVAFLSLSNELVSLYQRFKALQSPDRQRLTGREKKVDIALKVMVVTMATLNAVAMGAEFERILVDSMPEWAAICSAVAMAAIFLTWSLGASFSSTDKLRVYLLKWVDERSMKLPAIGLGVILDITLLTLIYDAPDLVPDFVLYLLGLFMAACALYVIYYDGSSAGKSDEQEAGLAETDLGHRIGKLLDKGMDFVFLMFHIDAGQMVTAQGAENMHAPGALAASYAVNEAAADADAFDGTHGEVHGHHDDEGDQHDHDGGNSSSDEDEDRLEVALEDSAAHETHAHHHHDHTSRPQRGYTYALFILSPPAVVVAGSLDGDEFIETVGNDDVFLSVLFLIILFSALIIENYVFQKSMSQFLAYIFDAVCDTDVQKHEEHGHGSEEEPVPGLVTVDNNDKDGHHHHHAHPHDDQDDKHGHHHEEEHECGHNHTPHLVGSLLFMLGCTDYPPEEEHDEGFHLLP